MVPTIEDITDMVSSIFEIKTSEVRPDFIQFKVDQNDTKSKFQKLAQKLEMEGLMCRLEQRFDGIYLMVMRIPPRKKGILSKSWVPRILFAIVVIFVMVDGYYRTVGANKIIQIGDPLEMAIIYTICLLGILGVHELGHLVASKLHGLKTTWPYFIPGIPIFGIPTLGAFIQSKGLTINREILFDIAVAGPIAGLVITILVSIYGAYTAPIIPAEMAVQLHTESKLIEWGQGESLFMTGALAMFGKGVGTEILLTPVLFAAWVGFLLTFLNLLPAWQLDGGHMARTLLGQKWHRYATFASMGVLVLLGYWVMAMFILVLSSRNSGAQPLDDISPLSKNRKIIYCTVIALAVLCAPLPLT